MPSSMIPEVKQDNPSKKWRPRHYVLAIITALAILRLVAGLAVESYVLKPRFAELSGILQSEISYRSVGFGLLGPSVTLRGLKIPHPRNHGNGPLLEAEKATVSLSWWSLPDQRALRIKSVELEGALFQGQMDACRSLIPALCLPAALLGGAYDAEGHYVPRYRYILGELEIEGSLRLVPIEGQAPGDFVVEGLHVEGEDLHNLPDGPEGSLEISGKLGTSTLRLQIVDWMGFDDFLHAASGRVLLEVPELELAALNPLFRHYRALAEILQGSADLQWNLELDHGAITKAEAPVVLKSLRLMIEDPASPMAPIEPWLKMTGGAFSAPLPISGTLEKPRIGFMTLDMKRLLKN